MKKTKRLICLLLCMAMLLATMAGCGTKDSEDEAVTGSAPSQAAEKTASDEKITVRILKGKAANEVNLEEMEIFKIMGEKFNIDFEFDNPPVDNYEERLNLVMMDDTLPDVIMDMPMTDILKYGEAGVIIPLQSYI